MDIQTIAAAGAACQQAVSIVQYFLNKSKEAAVQEKAIELRNTIFSIQEYLFSVQAKNAELLESCREWKEKALKKEEWAREKKKYTLKEVIPGSFVYTQKKQTDLSEPLHWLCTNCFKDEKKSILQFKKIHTFGPSYFCFECKNHFVVPPSMMP
ncbi:MAG: hypothetical protein NTX71_01945 [Candidatus Aureabacteria bacterium]|nr:hypothetical protein [Candidatus Auribacterota bacterium]